MDNKLKIINYLGKNPGKSFTMHELSKLVKMPYATFYRTVKQMTDLITTEKVGHSKTVRINLVNPNLRSYLTISSDQESKEFLKNQPIIRKIAAEIGDKDIILVFGSYAKGTETKSSDIDMLIINKDGKRTVSFSKYELLFKKKINPIFVTLKEFRLMLGDMEENVGKQALKNHIVLNNPESFWGCVLNAV